MGPGFYLRRRIDFFVVNMFSQSVPLSSEVLEMRERGKSGKRVVGITRQSRTRRDAQTLFLATQ